MFADAEAEAETNSKCWRWRRTSGSKIFSDVSTVCKFELLECFPEFDERLNQGAGAAVVSLSMGTCKAGSFFPSKMVSP